MDVWNLFIEFDEWEIFNVTNNKAEYKTTNIIVNVTEKTRNKLNYYIPSLEMLFGFIVGIIYLLMQGHEQEY
jgi:hypothetical protein